MRGVQQCAVRARTKRHMRRVTALRFYIMGVNVLDVDESQLPNIDSNRFKWIYSSKICILIYKNVINTNN